MLCTPVLNSESHTCHLSMRLELRRYITLGLRLGIRDIILLRAELHLLRYSQPLFCRLMGGIKIGVVVIQGSGSEGGQILTPGAEVLKNVVVE